MSDEPKGTIPKTNSAQWKKNEKLINQDPALKRVRDIQQGIDKPAHKYGQTHGGKGSAPRTDINSQQWKDNYDAIDWSTTRQEKKNYRTKINGRYIDEDE